MADGAQIFNIGIAYTSGQAKARDFKFGASAFYEDYYIQMQN